MNQTPCHQVFLTQEEWKSERIEFLVSKSPLRGGCCAKDPEEGKRKWQVEIQASTCATLATFTGLQPSAVIAPLLLLQLCCYLPDLPLSSLLDHLMWYLPSSWPATAPTSTLKSPGWWTATVMDWALPYPSNRRQKTETPTLDVVESKSLWLVRDSNTNHILMAGWWLWGSQAYFDTQKYFIILSDLLNSFLERGCYILNMYYRGVIVFSNESFFSPWQ